MVSPFPLANVLEWFFQLASGDLQPAKDRRHHHFGVGKAPRALKNRDGWSFPSPRLARLMTDDVSPLGIMGRPPDKQAL
jgi:hypothetical protein